MSNWLRAAALLLLAFTFTACPAIEEPHVQSRVVVPPVTEEPTPTPTPYEDPQDCECVRDTATGKVMCNSACSGRRK